MRCTKSSEVAVSLVAWSPHGRLVMLATNGLAKFKKCKSRVVSFIAAEINSFDV